MLYVCTKFHEEILNGFNVYRVRKQTVAGNKQRSILTSALKVRLRFFYSAHCLIMPFICAKFYGEILNGFKVIERT